MRERGPEGKVRERRERSGLRGVAREAQGDEGEAAGSRRWPGRVRARVGHAPSSWQGEEDDRGGGGGLGCYSGGLAPLVATQVRPGKLSLSSVF